MLPTLKMCFLTRQDYTFSSKPSIKSLVLKLYIHKQIIPITNNDKFDCPFPPSTHLLTVIDDINRSISPTYQAVQPSHTHSDVLWSDGWTLQNMSMCKVIQLTNKSLLMFSKISNLGCSLHSLQREYHT